MYVFMIFWGLVPGFVSWVLGIVGWVLGIVFGVSGIVFWMLGLVFWVLGFVFLVSGLVFWVLGLAIHAQAGDPLLEDCDQEACRQHVNLQSGLPSSIITICKIVLQYENWCVGRYPEGLLQDFLK